MHGCACQSSCGYMVTDHNMFSIDLHFIWQTDEMQEQIVVNDNGFCYIGNMLFLYKISDLYST